MNTKARHTEIYTAAAAALAAAGGVEKIDNLDQAERPAVLRQLYHQVVEATSCHYDTAKRNVVKAMHRARYGIMQERWGGTREGAGRPKMSKILRKTMWINKASLTRVNRKLTEYGYPAISQEEYVSNIMQELGGADQEAQQEVYEIISYALNFSLVDAEGYEYTPRWLQ